MSSLLKNNRPNIKPNAIIGVMPDKTVSTPMVKHTMNIGKCVTEFLNSGQIHVLCRRSTDTAVHGEEGQTYTLKFLLEFANNTPPGGNNGNSPMADKQMVRIVRFCEE